jgi:hypothetical protein
MTTTAQEHDDRRSLLEPPQFALRTLFVAMTLVGALLALMNVLGALWSITLVFFLCLVLAHVAGNALGTKLRQNASRSEAAGELLGAASPSVRREDLSAIAPPRLAERTRLSGGLMVIAALGALLGGSFGAAALATAEGQRITAAGIALGAFSSAVLGGFVGFLIGSFLTVSGGALREALGDHPRPRPVHGRRFGFPLR